jgi:nicotinate-nucleotide--dimethylbenzimidazole phosphoribosyltransferase
LDRITGEGIGEGAAEPATEDRPDWQTAPTAVSPAIQAGVSEAGAEDEAPAPEPALETTLVEEAIQVPEEPAPAVANPAAPPAPPAPAPEAEVAPGPPEPPTAEPVQPPEGLAPTVELEPAVPAPAPAAPEESAPALGEESIPTVEAEPVTLDGLELELNELPDLPLPGVGADSGAPAVEQEPMQLERAAEDALPVLEPVEAAPEVPPEAPLPSEVAALPDGGVGGGVDPSALDLSVEEPQQAEEALTPTEEMTVGDSQPDSEGPILIMPEGLEPTAPPAPPAPSVPSASLAPSPAGGEAATAPEPEPLEAAVGRACSRRRAPSPGGARTGGHGDDG